MSDTLRHATAHPTLPRRVPTRACYECNRKKTKCDMARPICGLCDRTGTSCRFPIRRKRPVRRGRLWEQGSEHLSAPAVQRSPGNHPTGGSTHGVLEESPSSQQFTGSNGKSNMDLGVASDPDLRSGGIPLEGSTFSLSASTFSQAAWQRQMAAFDGQCVSFSLAMHLVHVFFDSVQPWLPLLHKPRFLAYCTQALTRSGSDALASISESESLLFLSIFALSARFSRRADLAHIQPIKRGEIFAQQARTLYDKAPAGSASDVGLARVKGSILLAFYYYTSGLTSDGWVFVGTCIRHVYELGLHELDEPHEADEGEEDGGFVHTDWVHRESLRRLWWLVWELDSWGSIISQKPLAIDSRHMHVLLPVDDSCWFAERRTESAEVSISPGRSWSSLIRAENQSSRAWFLVALFLLSQLHDRCLLKKGVIDEEKTAMKNDLGCLRLALPESYQLHNQAPWASSKHIWVAGTHLVLSVAEFMVLRMTTAGSDGSDGAMLEKGRLVPGEHPSSPRYCVCSLTTSSLKFIRFL